MSLNLHTLLIKVYNENEDHLGCVLSGSSSDNGGDIVNEEDIDSNGTLCLLLLNGIIHKFCEWFKLLSK